MAITVKDSTGTTQSMKTSADGADKVPHHNVDASALPSGASTEATLALINAKLVTGTVIGDVNLGAVDNAVLDAIAASLAGTLTVGSHAVTNAGTFAVQESGAALTALQLIDNAISGAGFNITQFGGAAVPIGPGLEATAVRVSLPTDGTGVVGITGAALTALQVIDNFISGSRGLVTEDNSAAIAASLAIIDNVVFGTGTEAAALRVTLPTDGTGVVKLGAGVAEIGNVKNAGTFAVQVDGAALTALQLIDDAMMPITPATATATKTVGLGAEYRSTVPTWTNTQQGALQVGTRGSLHVEMWNTDSATPVPSGSGTEAAALRVTLPTNGTGIVGLAAGTNNVGDVDVLSVIPGTGATNLGKAVDTAIGATDTGVLALVMRDNVLAALTPAETDAAPLRVDTNGALWVRQSMGTGVGTQSIVADNAASVTILAANTARAGAAVANDSSAVLYLLVGTGTASATVYTVRMVQYGYYEVPAGYTGIVSGIWASDPGDGAARVTEWS